MTTPKPTLESSSALKGRWVSFRVEDSLLPSPADLLLELHSDDRLHGQVVDVSDDGSREGVFVVVRVPRVVEPVVVRADCLLGAT
jgi:hypothetical protein